MNGLCKWKEIGNRFSYNNATLSTSYSCHLWLKCSAKDRIVIVSQDKALVLLRQNLMFGMSLRTFILFSTSWLWVG